MSYYTICPICGVHVKAGVSLIAAPGIPAAQQHRCREKVIRSIDATLATERTEADHRRFGDRLQEGFRMMGDDE